MLKKLLGILVVISLMLSCTIGFADGAAPSPTQGRVETASVIVSESGTVMENVKITATTGDSEKVNEVVAELAAIVALLEDATAEEQVAVLEDATAEGQVTVSEDATAEEQVAVLAEYFGEESMTKAVELMTESAAMENVTLTKVKVAEVMSLSIENDQPITETLYTSFHFETEYEEGTPMVAMISIVVDGVEQWFTVEASVVDGSVVIGLTPEILEAIQGVSDTAVVLVTGETEETDGTEETDETVETDETEETGGTEE